VPFPEAPAAWRAKAAELHDETDAEFAGAAGEGVGEYRETVKALLANLLDGKELRIRMKPSDLERWLSKGERLTFHTTGITNGRDDAEALLEFEQEMLGIALDELEEKRPRYGYVRGSEERGNELNGFGNVLVRLQDLRAHATVTLGDSMGSATTVPSIPGGWACMVAEPLGKTEDLLCRYPLQNVVGATQLHDACDQCYQYAEVQIYDPLKPNTIKHVAFCNGEPIPDDARNLLHRWGIEYEEIDGVLP